MKKYIYIAALAFVYSFASASDQKTVVMTANSCSNLLGSFNGTALITAIQLTSAANNTALVTLWDTPTNSATYSAPAYSTYRAYPTNVITTWTDYQGRSTSITNVGQTIISNYVAAATVNYPVRATVTAATNTTVLLNNVDYMFHNGIWATNIGSGTATVTITYQQ